MALADKSAGTQGAIWDQRFGDAREAITSGQSAQREAFTPLGDLGRKYGRGTNLYMDALGINGPAGSNRAVGAFRTAPGYEFARDEGLEALRRTAAANGMLGSGNTGVDTMRYATGFADQGYGDWLTRLGGFMSPELSATSGYADRMAGTYDGTPLANLYMTDAEQRMGIDRNLLGARTGANDAIANAEMQGSANLWNLGLSLAGLGTQAYGSYKGDQGAKKYLNNMGMV